jgi:hypothetical protein
VDLLKEIRDELIAQRTSAEPGAESDTDTDTDNTPALAARLAAQRTSTEDGPKGSAPQP